ncbi:32943_t:CDS:2, partial [Racocetra persica]
IEVTTQSVVQHEKITDAQVVNEPEEIKYADKQVINPESNHSMSQENNKASNSSDRTFNSDRTYSSDRTSNNSIKATGIEYSSDRTSNNSIKVTGIETVEVNVKRTDDQQYEQEMNQQHRQEKNQQKQNKQYGQPQSVISQQSDDIRQPSQPSQRSQVYQIKKQTGQLENNLTYDQSTRNPNSSNHNIQDVIDNKNETIKMSLTPALGSDFMDFSDEEDEGNKPKTRPSRPLEKVGSDNELTRINIASSESIKIAEKKEEEPVKQVSPVSTPVSTPMVDNVRRGNQPSSSAPPPQNNSKAQRPSPLTNQQQSQSPQSGSLSNRSSPQIGSMTNRSQFQQV